jgi:hypothetical protein
VCNDKIKHTHVNFVIAPLRSKVKKWTEARVFYLAVKSVFYLLYYPWHACLCLSYIAKPGDSIERKSKNYHSYLMESTNQSFRQTSSENDFVKFISSLKRQGRAAGSPSAILFFFFKKKKLLYTSNPSYFFNQFNLIPMPHNLLESRSFFSKIKNPSPYALFPNNKIRIIENITNIIYIR